MLFLVVLFKGHLKYFFQTFNEKKWERMMETESTIVIEYREKEIVKFREEADS